MKNLPIFIVLSIIRNEKRGFFHAFLDNFYALPKMEKEGGDVVKRRGIAFLISVVIVVMLFWLLPGLFKEQVHLVLLLPFWYYAVNQYIKTYQTKGFLGSVLLFGIVWGMIVLCSMRYGKNVQDETELMGYMFVNYILWFAVGYILDQTQRTLDAFFQKMLEFSTLAQGKE